MDDPLDRREPNPHPGSPRALAAIERLEGAALRRLRHLPGDVHVRYSFEIDDVP